MSSCCMYIITTPLVWEQHPQTFLPFLAHYKKNTWAIQRDVVGGTFTLCVGV